MHRLAYLMVAAWLLSGVALAMAGTKPDGDKPKKPSFQGVVSSIDANNKAFVAAKKGGGGGELTIKTDANTKFTLADKPATFEDLKKGLPVAVWLGKDVAGPAVVVAIAPPAPKKDAPKKDAPKNPGKGEGGKKDK